MSALPRKRKSAERIEMSVEGQKQTFRLIVTSKRKPSDVAKGFVFGSKGPRHRRSQILQRENQD